MTSFRDRLAAARGRHNGADVTDPDTAGMEEQMETEPTTETNETPLTLEIGPRPPAPDEALPMHVRHALGELLGLEDRRARMRERARTEARAADDLDREIEAAQTAVTSAEAASIVEPTEDTAAAESAAQGRLADLQDRQAKHRRAAQVLRDEAAKLTPEIDGLRRRTFEAAQGALGEMVSGLEKTTRARLADLLPDLIALRTADFATIQASVGSMGASISDGARLKMLDDLIAAAGGGPGKEAKPPESVRSLRQVAALCSPHPERMQSAWFDDDDLRERLAVRRGEATEAERTRLEGLGFGTPPDAAA